MASGLSLAATFDAVREAGAGTVMCGYNLVNGQPSCGNDALLNGVLRGE